MDKSRVEQFFYKLCELQDEYGIHLGSEYFEDWDYDCNDEPCLIGINTYVVLMNKDSHVIGTIDEDGDLVYHDDAI